VANLVLVEAMKKTGATVAATIYRLNLVFVAVIAFFFLGEVVTGHKLLALVCAVVAVLLFANGGANRATFDKYILFLVGASFLRACMGICYKVASNHAVSNEVFLALSGVCWMGAGGAYYLWRQEHALPCGRPVFGFALVSGLLICGIVLFMKLAVTVGDASVAVTISQFSFLVTCPVAAVALKERCTVKQLMGIALAAVCVALFAYG
jgi:drug/metabolite transporter (DMT)-like permease